MKVHSIKTEFSCGLVHKGFMKDSEKNYEK